MTSMTVKPSFCLLENIKVTKEPSPLHDLTVTQGYVSQNRCCLDPFL